MVQVGTATPATPKVHKYIAFDTSTFVAHITLNHPPYNVLTVPLMVEVAEAVESLNGRNDIKCIVLDSSQKAFCAGISLEDSKADRVFQTLDAFNRIFQAFREILTRINEFSGPVLEMTKTVISSSLGLPWAEAMKKSQDIYLNQLMDLEDVQEGLRAVLEKRKPVWKNK